MSTLNLPKKSSRRLFRPLSIQQRLPLVICILLAATVISVSLISYIGVKKASIEVGKQRLRSLTGQLSGMFGQSSQGVLTATRTIAQQDSVKNFLLSGGNSYREEALDALSKLHRDTSSVLVELLNANLQPVLQSGKNGIRSPLDGSIALHDTPVKPDSCHIGKIYFQRDSMFYPVIASVVSNHQTIGYVLRWRLLISNPKSVSQLSDLLGTNATLYIGNSDGSLWTDLLKPVQRQPWDSIHKAAFHEYYLSGVGDVIATSMPVANTRWTLLIEFSRQKLTETASRFLRWIILIGIVIIAIGSFIAWLISRRMTKPLNELTAAATAIAGGDYSSAVNVTRRDEVGKLANAFNTMATKVSNAQHMLEHKVQERTVQLESANTELEAFSYSVSHDLRAPLRAINGYARMLQEDHQDKLDGEANRLLNTIVSNTVRMGQLIDDLLAFARMGRKDLIPHEIDMKKLAQSSLHELIKTDKRYNIHVAELPSIPGDQALLKQVWMNLLDNAIKYSSKVNAPSIDVGFREDQNNVVYFIRDNGAGFDMRYSDKLFGIFQRLHDQDSFDGTGIGLALVKRIISRHAGHIWAEAAVDKGATFYFSLPRSIQYQ